MANENRLPEVDEASVPKKAKKAKPKFRARLAKWFREMKSELKKVVWPTPKQIVNNTMIALVMMFASAVVIWGFDSLASSAVQALIAIFY